MRGDSYRAFRHHGTTISPRDRLALAQGRSVWVWPTVDLILWLHRKRHFQIVQILAPSCQMDSSVMNNDFFFPPHINRVFG